MIKVTQIWKFRIGPIIYFIVTKFDKTATKALRTKEKSSKTSNARSIFLSLVILNLFFRLKSSPVKHKYDQGNERWNGQQPEDPGSRNVDFRPEYVLRLISIVPENRVEVEDRSGTAIGL